MFMQFKPIENQVIFITGATTDVGVALTQIATKKGACVFMTAKNEAELARLQEQMQSQDLHTAYAVAELTEPAQLRAAADQCVQTFGRIDTWVNNAGGFIENHLGESFDDESRRVFDTNFWGVVNGSQVAAEVMKEQEGVVVNLASSLSEGLQEASKKALKAYTDDYRRILKHKKIPLALSYVEPSGDAMTTAKAILSCATKPVKTMKASLVPATTSFVTSSVVAGGLTLFFLKRFRLI